LERFRKNSDATENHIFIQKTKKISKLHVRFSPLSINKNDKPDREKNYEYFANGSSDFNRTKKFGISAKNYLEDKTTREEP
jgi:hypothetical protein